MRKKELIKEINEFYVYLTSRKIDCTEPKNERDIGQLQATSIIRGFFLDTFRKVIK